MNTALYHVSLVSRAGRLIVTHHGREVEEYSPRHRGEVMRRLVGLDLTGRRDPAGAIRSALADLD